jgi:hypothetical protein
LAKGAGRTIANQPDGNTWFFITVDYSFGHALEADTARFVKEAGGHVLGSAPLPHLRLLVVPRERRDPVAGSDAVPVQDIRQLPDTSIDF